MHAHSFGKIVIVANLSIFTSLYLIVLFTKTALLLWQWQAPTLYQSPASLYTGFISEKWLLHTTCFSALEAVH
jgi:hypothetical protein